MAAPTSLTHTRSRRFWIRLWQHGLSAALFCVLFSLMGKKRSLREMFCLVLAMGLYQRRSGTVSGIGPLDTFHAGPPDSFVP